MSRWKTLTTSWWTKNLFEIACATMVVALLVGGIAYAIVLSPTVQVVAGESAKASEELSAAVPLSPVEEDRSEIVCLPGGALPAEGGEQPGCDVISKSEGSLQVAPEVLPAVLPVPASPLATATDPL